MAVVSVLSERDRRAIAAAEAFLLEHDEPLVRSFDALARHDSPDAGRPALSDLPIIPDLPVRRPDPARSRARRPESGTSRSEGGGARGRRWVPKNDRLLQVVFGLGVLGMLGVCGWIFYAGDSQIRLLTALVMFPVLALTAYTVVVLNRRDDRGGR